MENQNTRSTSVGSRPLSSPPEAPPAARLAVIGQAERSLPRSLSNITMAMVRAWAPGAWLRPKCTLPYNAWNCCCTHNAQQLPLCGFFLPSLFPLPCAHGLWESIFCPTFQATFVVQPTIVRPQMQSSAGYALRRAGSRCHVILPCGFLRGKNVIYFGLLETRGHGGVPAGPRPTRTATLSQRV